MHPHQRSWDALLILHWRRNSVLGALSKQCKEMLGAYPQVFAEEGMLRCGEFMKATMNVRVWVDTYLHPLGVKLWDVEDNKRVLDWLNASTGLDCHINKKVRRWQSEGTNQTRLARLHVQQSRISVELGKRGNRQRSPNTVKAVRSRTR